MALYFILLIQLSSNLTHWRSAQSTYIFNNIWNDVRINDDRKNISKSFTSDYYHLNAALFFFHYLQAILHSFSKTEVVYIVQLFWFINRSAVMTIEDYWIDQLADTKCYQSSNLLLSCVRCLMTDWMWAVIFFLTFLNLDKTTSLVCFTY